MRYDRLDRLIARVLVAAIVLMTPLSASAGGEWQDPNQATYDASVVSVDNTLAGETNITIDTDRTIIEWQDFQQPAANTLDFHFSEANASSSVLNRIGAQNASNVFGRITSNGQVILANPFGVFIREGAVVDVGSLVAVGANISREDYLTAQSLGLSLTGVVGIEYGAMVRAEDNIALLGRSVVNHGSIHSERGYVLAVGGRHVDVHDWDAITADFLAPKYLLGFLADGRVENHGTITAPDAALFGGHIENMGDIEVRDGTLLMVAANSVWVTEFDNPVLFEIPSYDPSTAPTSGTSNGDVRYAIENHGRIDAGLGHVRLSASDPLGFAIRQGTGTTEAPAMILAQEIDLEGGETGRVHLSGEIDASDLSENGVGGEIDITGAMVVLEGANVHASGSTGGGTIHVGGEREGRGELQRASLALVDEDSEIHADAIQAGDGGEVIVFAEELTSVDGEITARGGSDGGDGGFVETSGLRSFLISRTPDVTAPLGNAGEWLIDPFNITIDDTVPDHILADGTPADTNLNNAILAILDPSFDSAGFDGILRTVREATMDANGVTANLVSAELIADALATGTSVTLSTQAFGIDRGDEFDGDISILSSILIDSADTLEGTIATLTLLAAGDINVESDIITSSPMAGDSPNLTLNVELRANDLGQVESDQDFDVTVLEGDVLLNGSIETGGGDVVLSGSSVILMTGQTIETDGGDVDIRSGTVDRFGAPVVVTRRSSDPALDAMTPDPRIDIVGTIDTCITTLCDGPEAGGDVTLVASSINVLTSQAGPDAEQIVSGQLTIDGSIMTGGGDIALSGGRQLFSSDSHFTGNVDINAPIDSGGGDVTIFSNHLDPTIDTGSTSVSFLRDPLGLGGIVEGGFIDIDANVLTDGGALSIGSEQTRSIQMDGTFDTQSSDTTENGLVQLVSRDLGGVDTANDQFGQSEILIGQTTTTTISTSSLVIQSREVTFSEGAGANAVSLIASGSSTATLPNLSTEVVDETATIEPPTRGAISITGDRQLTFNQNTSLVAESIEITAAAQPTDLNTSGPSGDERVMSETRIVFGGTGGADSTLGVRLNADSIMISVGDGTTPSSDGFIEDLGTSADPTEFGLQRLTRASYDGLQLRATAGAELPADLQISQDGDLTITSVAPIAAGELDLVGAFDTDAIGADGMHLTLESSDGRLIVEDAIGLNNDVGVMPGSDAGKSFVVLNGGLFADDSVRFRDGVANLGADGTTAFDVESLTVSSAGDFTISQQVIDSIDPLNLPNELVFEAGRRTDLPNPAGRGTLTVDPGFAIQAGDRLALLAGASGFGDLIFSGAGPLTTLAADDIELRAGAGTDSQNTSTAARSSISGLQSINVAIRDARFAALGNAAVFGETGSSATSFSVRQDAAIDAQSDLPDLAQFGLGATGFRTAGDVEYSVRSDEGNIDLDDDIVGTNEGDRFQNSNLSLIGVDSSVTPAVDVSSDFAFVGKRVELGGIGNFTFTQSLAAAFNRSGLDGEEEITLRAGAGGLGNLAFNRGSQSSVLVKAPRINLVAGNGIPIDDQGTFVGESSINTRNAVFDLAGPAGSTPTFTFHTASDVVVADLPDNDQFMTEIMPGIFQELLPDILAIRTDFGRIRFEDFDVSELPLDLVDAGRLILEAEEIRLAQTDGDNLDLTNGHPNLKLRFRANNLILQASNSVVDFALNASVLLAPQPGDALQPNVAVSNSSFDNESLLIEAFDLDATSVTADNLSSQSEDTPGSDLYTLANGRGPNSISIIQDGAVTPGNIFQRDAVAGQLTRSVEDDQDGNEIATIYTLTSVVNSVTFDPENVNGSSLIVSGTTQSALDSSINFGSPGTPGVFFFENVFASTESSIVIQDGTDITASDTISLAAGQLTSVVDNPLLRFGSLEFENDLPATSSLTANKITLTAGPAFKLVGLDLDADGDPIPIAEMFLPRVKMAGLDLIALTGDQEDSALTITQSASLAFERGTDSDFLSPAEAGMAAGQWATFNLSLIQGDLTLDELDVIATIADSFAAQTNDLDAKIVVNMPDAIDSMTPSAPFDSFVGTVEFLSNDILFQSTDPNTSISLATDKLSLVNVTTLTGDETEEELAEGLGVLRDADPDANNRPIVRIHQARDFTSSELPRPDQYFLINQLGARNVRTDLSRLDIELLTTGTGTNLTLDDGIRARVTNANLILDSEGDINIMLDGPTPGFDGLDYADLQLTSLDFTAEGNINIRPFMSGGSPATLTIETAGDQRFTVTPMTGAIQLENTLSTRGRDIRFAGDVDQVATPTAGLLVASSGKVVFEGDIGSAGPLDHLVLANDSDADFGTPNVEFGTRTTDPEGNVTPDSGPQTVEVENDILFVSYDFDEGDRTAEIANAIGMATTLAEIETALADEGIGRTRAATFATIGKADGDLTFTSNSGNFVMGSGEKLSVGGVATIDVNTGVATLGDVSAVGLTVTAGEIGLVRRDSGVYLDRSGETQQDGGASISANTFNFGSVTPTYIGSGRSFRFGVPNPFDTASLPPELSSFPLFEIKASGAGLVAEDFRFLSTTGDLAFEVPTLPPRGASRSDLSGAFGPEVEPTPIRKLPDYLEPPDPERFIEIDVEAIETPNEIRLARLGNVAVIDDLGRSWEDGIAAVTTARIDADDAEAAIALYEELFGKAGNRSAKIRAVLQDSLDRYLENSRARRVVGFELRRFVKNRPSTLLEAYTTLESLDTLFRYHRRLGLSPGEYRGIQKNWLRQIQPDGISLDELSEAIHPSRYVRGSDILDIFGR